MSCADSSAGPLTAAEVASFVDRGFVRLQNAFPPEAAAAVRNFLWRDRLQPAGIARSDPSTWVLRHGIPEVFAAEAGGVGMWSDVLTARLHAGIDQILGEGRWAKPELGCGWWVVSFPGQEAPPWGPSGRFHVDGAHFRHFPHSKEQALLPIFLFSDIGEGEGGTALAAGSHSRVAQLLLEHEREGLPGGELTRRALKLPGVLDDLVEVNGKAGDVVLLHPFLVHARSKNLGLRGLDSVRFGCFPAVALRESMDLDRDDEQSYSAVETAIVRARERSVCPVAFGGGKKWRDRGGGRSAAPRRKQKKRRKRRRGEGDGDSGAAAPVAGCGKAAAAEELHTASVAHGT